jgi:hypothetical protein
VSGEVREHAERPRSGLSAEPTEFVYRPISTLAVLCLVASVLSLVSFLDYHLIAPAAVVLAVSVATSVRLDRAKQEYGGQIAAKIAIILGLIATIGAGTSHYIRYVVVTRSARDYGEEFLRALLEDDLEGAFAMTVAPVMREASGMDLQEMILRHNKEYEEFKKNRLTRALRAGDAAEDKARVRFLGVDGHLRPEGLDLVGLRYEVTLATGNRPTYEVRLGVIGGVVPQGWKGRQWWVKYHDEFKAVEPPATESRS